MNRTKVSQCSAAVEKQTNSSVESEAKAQAPETKTQTPSLPTAYVESISPTNVPISKIDQVPNLKSNISNQGSSTNLESNNNKLETINEPLENREVEPTPPAAIPVLELPTSEDISRTHSAAELTIDPSFVELNESEMLAVDDKSFTHQPIIRIVTDRDRSLDLLLESLPPPTATERTELRIIPPGQQTDTTPIADSETDSNGSITQDLQEFEELPTGHANAVVAGEVTLHARAVQPYQAPGGNKAQLLDLDSLLPTIPSKPLDVGQFDDTRFLADIDNNWRFVPLPKSWPFADGTRHPNSASSSEYEFTPLPKLVARESNPISRNTSGISANLQPSARGSVTDVIVDLIAPQLDTNPATAARPIQKPGDRR